VADKSIVSAKSWSEKTKDLASQLTPWIKDLEAKARQTTDPQLATAMAGTVSQMKQIQNEYKINLQMHAQRGAGSSAEAQVDVEVKLGNAIIANDVATVASLIESLDDIDAKNAEEQTALHLAAEYGKLEIVKLLVKKGANINAQDDYGLTPLYSALLEKHPGVARFLIKQGANVQAQTKDGNTALHVAVQNNYLGISKILIEKGADPRGSTHSSLYSPLLLAMASEHFELAKMLIEKGADINERNGNGYAPLHFAAEKGHIEILTLLLDLGANIEAASRKNRTPLHLAVKKGVLESVKVLIEKGANPNRKDHDDKSILQAAIDYGPLEVVRILLEKGAFSNLPNNELYSCMVALLRKKQEASLEAQKECSELFAMLEKKEANLFLMYGLMNPEQVKKSAKFYDQFPDKLQDSIKLYILQLTLFKPKNFSFQNDLVDSKKTILADHIHKRNGVMDFVSGLIHEKISASQIQLILDGMLEACHKGDIQYGFMNDPVEFKQVFDFAVQAKSFSAVLYRLSKKLEPQAQKDLLEHIGQYAQMSTGKRFDKVGFEKWANAFYTKNSQYLMGLSGEYSPQKYFKVEVLNQIMMQGHGHSRSSHVDRLSRFKILEAALKSKKDFSVHIPLELKDSVVTKAIGMSVPKRNPDSNVKMNEIFREAPQVFAEVLASRENKLAIAEAQKQLVGAWTRHAQAGVQSSLNDFYLSALRLYWLKNPERTLPQNDWDMLSELQNLVSDKDYLPQVFSEVLPLATQDSAFSVPAHAKRPSESQIQSMLIGQVKNFKAKIQNGETNGEELKLSFYIFLAKSGSLGHPHLKKMIENSSSPELDSQTKQMFMQLLDNIGSLDETQKKRAHLMSAATGLVSEINASLSHQKRTLFIKSEGAEVQIEFFASKDIIQDSLHGTVTGACTAAFDPQNFNNPNFFLIKMVQSIKTEQGKETDRKVIGYAHVFMEEVTINGKKEKVMFLPGINPTSEFMAKMDGKKMLGAILSSAKEMANSMGVRLAIPDDPLIYSNRPELKEAIKAGIDSGALVRDPKALPKKIHWWGNQFPFNRVLWVR
jgi:ankyrin repeat protein